VRVSLINAIVHSENRHHSQGRVAVGDPRIEFGSAPANRSAKPNGGGRFARVRQSANRSTRAAQQASRLFLAQERGLESELCVVYD